MVGVFGGDINIAERVAAAAPADPAPCRTRRWLICGGLRRGHRPARCRHPATMPQRSTWSVQPARQRRALCAVCAGGWV